MATPGRRNVTSRIHRAHPYHSPLGNHRSPGPSSPIRLPPETRFPSSPVTPRKRYRAEGDDPFTPSPRPIRADFGTPRHVGSLFRDSPLKFPGTPHTPKARVVSTPLPKTPQLDDLYENVKKTSERVKNRPSGLPEDERIFIQQFERLLSGGRLYRPSSKRNKIERTDVWNSDQTPDQTPDQQEEVDLDASLAAKKEEIRKRRHAEYEAGQQAEREAEKAREEAEARRKRAFEVEQGRVKRAQERDYREKLARLKLQQEEAERERERRETMLKEEELEMETMRARQEELLQKERAAQARETREAAQREREELRRLADKEKARHQAFLAQMETIRTEIERARAQNIRLMEEETILARERVERIKQERLRAEQEAAALRAQESERLRVYEQYQNQQHQQQYHAPGFQSTPHEDFHSARDIPIESSDVFMRDPSIYIARDPSNASTSSISANKPSLPPRPPSPSPRPPSPSPPPPPPPPPPRPSTPAEWFSWYETRWDSLKSGVFPWGLKSEYLPWPVFCDVFHPEDITDEKLLAFYTHSDRPAGLKKNRKEVSKGELLKFHPDKLFKRYLVGKVTDDELAVVDKAITEITRFLLDFGRGR